MDCSFREQSSQSIAPDTLWRNCHEGNPRHSAGTGLGGRDACGLGAGVGLLLADRLSAEDRRAIGWTLLLVGAVTTIPLAFEILSKLSSSSALQSTGNAAASDVNDRSGRRFSFPTV